MRIMREDAVWYVRGCVGEWVGGGAFLPRVDNACHRRSKDSCGIGLWLWDRLEVAYVAFPVEIQWKPPLQRGIIVASKRWRYEREKNADELIIRQGSTISLPDPVQHNTSLVS